MLGAGCAGEDESQPEPRKESAAAVTVAAPSSEQGAGSGRRPPERLSRPANGSVAVEPGPFTDRVRIQRLRLERGARPRVEGELLSVTDVSDVIVLELQADFYDADGRLLGSGTRAWKEAEPFHDESLRFSVKGGADSADARWALLSVPQLVNE